MRHTACIVTAVLSGGIVLASAGRTINAVRPFQIWPVDERGAVADFNRRIQAYVDLHRRIEGPRPTVNVSGDPAEIREAIDKLGNAIRAERAPARQGDMFTPEISVIIRRTIQKNCDSDFRALLEMVHEDEPPMPAAVLNGRWPADHYPFMPPKLLLALPSLPEELEYLFVNRDLVLWDCHANVIVDILPNAIPRQTT